MSYSISSSSFPKDQPADQAPGELNARQRPASDDVDRFNDIFTTGRLLVTRARFFICVTFYVLARYAASVTCSGDDFSVLAGAK